jgi:hypothetical protein
MADNTTIYLNTLSPPIYASHVAPCVIVNAIDSNPVDGTINVSLALNAVAASGINTNSLM